MYTRAPSKEEWLCRDNVVYRRVMVYRDTVDLAFIDEYEALNEVVAKWEISEKGMWCIKNSLEKPEVVYAYDNVPDVAQIAIFAYFSSNIQLAYKLTFE